MIDTTSPNPPRTLAATFMVTAALQASVLAQDASTPQAPEHTNVYTSQFDQRIEIGMWSDARVGKAPDGSRFLGPYSGRSMLYQTLEKLPPHRYVRLRFDLMILHSWDGEAKNGPDTMHLSVRGGPLLLYTAFGNRITVVDPQRIANGDQARMPKLQSFPDEFPHLVHKAGTGASPDGAQLGFQFHRPDLKVESSLYKIDLVFPHSGEDLILQLGAKISDDAKDESWGLRNIIVDTIDADTPQSEEQLAKLWTQLSGKDPVAANDASWKIVAAGPEATAFVEKQFRALAAGGKDADKAAQKALQAKVATILKNVTADNFVERQQAQADLLALGEKAIPTLGTEMKTAKDPEVRRALRAVLTKLKKKALASGAGQHLELVASRVGRIRRIVETHANAYEITTSAKKKLFANDPIGAAADGYFPPKSATSFGPRFTWHPAKGSEEWLRYEFPKPKTISAAEVFWFCPNGKESLVPDSWKVEVLADDGSWDAVNAKGDYKLDIDKLNRVEFDPVSTKAVRLVAKLPDGVTGGVHEFRVVEAKAPE